MESRDSDRLRHLVLEGNPSSMGDLRSLRGSQFEQQTLQTGGHHSIEAKAERCVRERTEDRAGVLSGKAQKLMSVVSSQQLLIQRLEKQLVKEEDLLEQREKQLVKEEDLLEQRE